MPGKKQRGRFVGQRPSAFAVRRIAHGRVHAFTPDELMRVPHVSRVHMDAFLQPVQHNRAPCHIRHIRLDFKGLKAGVRLFLAHQQRQNARTGAHIGHPFAGP